MIIVTKYVYYRDPTESGVHNSNLMANQAQFRAISKGPNASKGKKSKQAEYIQFLALRAKCKASRATFPAGFMLFMPVLNNFASW